MTPESPVIAELRPLLDALCEESITPEQLARLEELVLTSPEAKAHYVRFMNFQADLVRTVGLPVPVNPVRASAPTVPAPGPARRRVSRRTALVLAALAASVVAVIAFVYRPRSSPRGMPDGNAEPTDETVAVLLQTYNAQWEDSGSPTRPGSPLPPGQLVLKSGYAQIEFYNGATVILEGPAEFRILSRTEGYCASGKLRATVPPQAHGFRIGSPALNLVDRGTEFGLNVEGAKTAVHVFKGEVHLYDPKAAPDEAPKELKTGEAISLNTPGVMHAIPADAGSFLTADELADRAVQALEQRQKEWAAVSAELRRDPSVVLYYTFETPGRRSVSNASLAPNSLHDGAVVGCSWGNGRWSGRQGLEFRRTSDRVRLHVPGTFDALTFATWCRPDALPNTNNSLLMADGWDEGECHWQIGSDGTLILGIKGPPGYNPEKGVSGPQYRAPGAITPALFGRWVHLAVTYDPARREVVHYVDGQPVARAEIRLDLPLRIGDGELGNWNSAGFRSKATIRNFTGCIDEFLVLRRALTSAEIERLHAQGRPPL